MPSLRDGEFCIRSALNIHLESLLDDDGAIEEIAGTLVVVVVVVAVAVVVVVVAVVVIFDGPVVDKAEEEARESLLFESFDAGLII